jgi:hypothetical protein
MAVLIAPFLRYSPAVFPGYGSRRQHRPEIAALSGRLFTPAVLVRPEALSGTGVRRPAGHALPRVTRAAGTPHPLHLRENPVKVWAEIAGSKVAA